MTDTDVRDALHRATRHLEPSVDLLDAVRRGGRRRLVRRRSVLAAGLAAVAAGSTAGAWRAVGGGDGPFIASPLLDEPSRGDLAGDRAYRERVFAVWRRHLGPAHEVREAPHLVWAGTTPAGPAAVVAQRVRPYVSAPGQINYGLIGFVEHTPAGPRAVSLETLGEGDEDGNSQAVLLGPDRDVLMVLDTGREVRYSPSFRYGSDGRVTRTFRPLTFRRGAAVLRVPPQRDRITIAVFRPPGDEVHIANLGEILFGDGRRSPQTRLLTRVLPGAARVWPADVEQARAELAGWAEPAMVGYFDAHGHHTAGATPFWSIWGVTPDGRRVAVQTHHYDDDPARLFGLLGRADGKPRVLYGGMVAGTAPLPVRLRLPDRQGVVVAGEGVALRYRVKAGDWLPVTGDAALLPDAATRVEVTRPGGAPPVVVDLP